MVDIKPENDDDIIQGSMITPFPAGNPGGPLSPDEPNFFWSGSGDDPDAGMTYWITTTVYKTAVVTMTPATPPTTPKPTSTTSKPTPAISIVPTPPVGGSGELEPPTWPMEAFHPRSWVRTVIRSNADESSPRFRQLIQSRLGRMYTNLSHYFRTGVGPSPRAHVIVQNITRRAGDVDVIYALSTWHRQSPGGSVQLVDPYAAAGAARRGDVTRELCHRSADDTQDMVLCQSVVTQAERNSRLITRPIATMNKERNVINANIFFHFLFYFHCLYVYIF